MNTLPIHQMEMGQGMINIQNVQWLQYKKTSENKDTVDD